MSKSDDTTESYLAFLGARVRQYRAQRGMSRRILAEASGVSQRYLAQLEGGQANASVLVLKAIADALDVAVDDVLDSRVEQSPDYRWLRQHLRDASDQQLLQWSHDFRAEHALARRTRVALIGLRGAGKSTLGQALAKQFSVPFVELVQEIERHAGTVVSEILSNGGQAAYRRLERDALIATLARFDRAVIAVGGSLVSEPRSFEILLSSCHCVWLQATPREHMSRVIAQGDHRPMANNRNAMADLKRMLAERRDLYARADDHLDTSSKTISESLRALSQIEGVRQLNSSGLAA